MTAKELRRLSRMELLQMLLDQSREVERLQQELQQAQSQLESRRLAMEQLGSIAEASLQLSGIFETAQRAADQYLENARQRGAEIEAECSNMLLETQEKCDAMQREAVEVCRALQAQAEQTEAPNPAEDWGAT